MLYPEPKVFDSMPGTIVAARVGRKAEVALRVFVIVLAERATDLFIVCWFCIVGRVVALRVVVAERGLVFCVVVREVTFDVVARCVVVRLIVLAFMRFEVPPELREVTVFEG